MALTKHLKTGAGRMNRLVVIQSASDATPNASGEVIPIYTDLCVRWAEMVTNSGREFVAAMQVVASLQCILKIRYDSVTRTITERDRIQIRSATMYRTLSIVAIFNENENNERIVMWCVETKDAI